MRLTSGVIPNFSNTPLKKVPATPTPRRLSEAVGAMKTLLQADAK